MRYERPTLTEYVIVKFVTIFIFVTALYSLAIFFTPSEYQNPLFHIGIFLLSLIFILSSVYVVSKSITKELKRVEEYLSVENSFNEKISKASFPTKEFALINIKLIQLLRKMKKRDRKKRKYTAKIKLKNRQRSDMLSAIAHEFRNPIAAIMGYAQTLNDDEDIPPKLRQRFLSKIYNNGEKIEELLGRLLLWNRFESGEQKLQLSRFDIQPLIAEVAMNLEDRYKTREISVDETSLFVRADKALMEIVLKNLIENALKYSDELVEVKIEEGRVIVIDRGVGISADNIDKVTKKFFRTEEHSWDNSMGLGLAIVKQILRLHETLLDIESVEGKGSSFSFLLSST
ncbi:HAMP domain-containing histidine kinase [Sulfurovum sp. bin170]|uniref:sensor histidine kinase n=1 Tax=Sulfurovum sp. bin170 TaxID=2695268 RepID=UPI0013DF80C9|nr:HAMP domain-containing sensor histidine kinase [Sulfurovum sp. bin170]NEW60408.1 HAMP domain-containing histidine kinase [Sulfurovum sp. bin170]